MQGAEQEENNNEEAQQDGATIGEGVSDQNQLEQDARKRASEQWLNRIPDDPAGLLKRKFRYQYQQRGQTTQQEQAW